MIQAVCSKFSNLLAQKIVVCRSDSNDISETNKAAVVCSSQ